MSALTTIKALHFLFILNIFAITLFASDLPTETHPFILYDSNMVETLRERIEREPYTDWWEELQMAAGWAMSYSFPSHIEYHKARYCKVLAFAYMITDSLPYADKCLEGLETIDPGGNWGGSTAYYQHADPLTFYCEAYDMLKGSGYDLGVSEVQIRADLAQKAQEFMDNWWILFYINNWKVRYLSALGIAAMTLADHPNAESWHDYAELQVINVFYNNQAAGEGAWAEGPYYHFYSAKIYMPYMLAFQRIISGADLVIEAPVQAVHDWNWRNRMPDGRRPNFEDAHLGYFYGSHLATVYENPGIYQWDFTAVPHPDSMYAERYWLSDAISYYDDSIAATIPDIDATIYLPEAGNMIFRSGWGLDDIYLFLIGEHGAARINGQGHDHPDATSFILCAYNEILGLDAGYIKWDMRGAVNKASNHSLILVDGEGPPSSTSSSAGDADAYLKCHYNIGSLQFCEDSTFYCDVSIKRSVLFVDSAFFLLRDRVDGSSLHTYNWQFHGNGGGDSGGEFILEEHSATWSRDDASLYATIDATSDLTFSTTLDTHSFAYDQILTHNTFDAECGSMDVDFLAAIYPVAANNPAPNIEILDFPDGVSLRFEEGVGISSEGTLYLLPNAISGFNDIVSDADFLYADILNNEVAYYTLDQCQHFTYDATEHFSADQLVVFALNRTGNTWTGFVRGGDEYTVNLYIGTISAPEILFNGSPANFSYQNQTAAIQLSGEGYLEIDLPPVSPPEVSIFYYNQQVTLSWDPVAGAESYNIYRSEEPYFDPGSMTPFAMTTDTSWTDTVVTNTASFYLVTSVYSDFEQ